MNTIEDSYTMLSKSKSVEGQIGIGNTAIAIDSDKNSQSAMKWAAENLLKGNPTFYLIHVRCQAVYPADEFVPKGGRPPTEAELQRFFLPYRGFCARKGITAKEVVLNDIDVPSALINYATNNSISSIVVGASNHSRLLRKFKAPDVPTALLKSAPENCSIYVVSKDKLQTSRPSTPRSTPKAGLLSLFSSKASQANVQSEPDTLDVNRSYCSPNSDCTSPGKSMDYIPTSITYQSKKSGPATKPLESFFSETSSKSSGSGGSNYSGRLSFKANDMPENLDASYASESSTNSVASKNSKLLDLELVQLKKELKQSLAIYHSACEEAVTAEEKVAVGMKKSGTNTQQKMMFSEETASALAKVERQNSKIAQEAAYKSHQQAEIETQTRKYSDEMTEPEFKEKQTVRNIFQRDVEYRRYTIEEIEEATDYFSASLKIGEGGYGPVFRGVLDNITVAVKVLRPDVSQGLQQFRHEVQVLSCLRHPSMVLLVGACPEYGCLVYEYMNNGSLEDRLFCKNNTPPIPWKIRFKIAAEIATGLLFLHKTKPEPLVHRDIKPSNILLDQNYESKISDVGLARLVPPSVANRVTEYRMTAAAGTFCYIDPEYQQTGMLGVKSDVYSLGVMLLQIITAKPPMGLAHQVHDAIEQGSFATMLDPVIKDWPIEAALSFAKIALACCELRKRDRPDLATVVLPELIRLRNLELKNGTINDSEKNRDNPHAYNSMPDIQSQIHVKGRWQRFKMKAPKWSLKSGFMKSKLFQDNKQPSGKPGQIKIDGCWSFVSCTTPDPHIKKFHTFT